MFTDAKFCLEDRMQQDTVEEAGRNRWLLGPLARYTRRPMNSVQSLEICVAEVVVYPEAGRR